MTLANHISLWRKNLWRNRLAASGLACDWAGNIGVADFGLAGAGSSMVAETKEV